MAELDGGGRDRTGPSSPLLLLCGLLILIVKGDSATALAAFALPLVVTGMICCRLQRTSVLLRIVAATTIMGIASTCVGFGTGQLRFAPVICACTFAAHTIASQSARGRSGWRRLAAIWISTAAAVFCVFAIGGYMSVDIFYSIAGLGTGYSIHGAITAGWNAAFRLETVAIAVAIAAMLQPRHLSGNRP